jgi:hypothetical protein
LPRDIDGSTRDRRIRLNIPLVSGHGYRESRTAIAWLKKAVWELSTAIFPSRFKLAKWKR